jgi:hypothetical protein
MASEKDKYATKTPYIFNTATEKWTKTSREIAELKTNKKKICWVDDGDIPPNLNRKCCKTRCCITFNQKILQANDACITDALKDCEEKENRALSLLGHTEMIVAIKGSKREDCSTECIDYRVINLRHIRSPITDRFVLQDVFIDTLAETDKDGLIREITTLETDITKKNAAIETAKEKLKTKEVELTTTVDATDKATAETAVKDAKEKLAVLQKELAEKQQDKKNKETKKNIQYEKKNKMIDLSTGESMEVQCEQDPVDIYETLLLGYYLKDTAERSGFRNKYFTTPKHDSKASRTHAHRKHYEVNFLTGEWLGASEEDREIAKLNRIYGLRCTM